MRLYKANLNDNFEVITYSMTEEIEDIYSLRTDITYNIPSDDIFDYVDLVGYITLPLKEEINNSTYIMYIDIDHTFSSIWDNDTSIYVADQIKTSIRNNVVNFANENYNNDGDLIGIVGPDKIYINEITYVYHRLDGGIWESSDDNIISIDRQSGIIEGLKLGKSSISYKVDSGAGILTCFLTIEVVWIK